MAKDNYEIVKGSREIIKGSIEIVKDSEIVETATKNWGVQNKLCQTSFLFIMPERMNGIGSNVEKVQQVYSG